MFAAMDVVGIALTHYAAPVDKYVITSAGGGTRQPTTVAAAHVV